MNMEGMGNSTCVGLPEQFGETEFHVFEKYGVLSVGAPQHNQP
jgi:hypothetical protein